jgi:hypothetical protein
MSQCFQVKVKDEVADNPGHIAEEMRGWFSYPLFGGMKCCERQVSEQLEATYFYPEPGDLRQRLAALESDPSPILEAVKHWWSSSPEEHGDYTQHIPPHPRNHTEVCRVLRRGCGQQDRLGTLAARLPHT